MSHNEATTPAVDWESRSISSLTTVLVSNTTHKVTPASMADNNIIPHEPHEKDLDSFSYSNDPSATSHPLTDINGDAGLGDDTSSVTNPSFPPGVANPADLAPIVPHAAVAAGAAAAAVGPDDGAAFEAQTRSARQAARIRHYLEMEVERDDLRARLDARTIAQAAQASAHEAAQAGLLEEIATLKAQLKAQQDGTSSSSSEQDPPDDTKKDEDENDDEDEKLDSKPSAQPFPNQGK